MIHLRINLSVGLVFQPPISCSGFTLPCGVDLKVLGFIAAVLQILANRSESRKKRNLFSKLQDPPVA